METIILDDGIEYIIIKEMNIKGITYTLFANVNDGTDICYRKTEEENGELFYVGLDDEKEFKLVNDSFAKELLREMK